MRQKYLPETAKKYKKILKEYIRKNLQCTYKTIKRDTKIKVQRLYPNGGLKQAYREAGVPLSDRLRRRSREQQIIDVLEFIKSNPSCTVTQVQDITNVTIPRVFGSIKSAYEMASVKYPKRDSQHNKNNIIEFVQLNPYASTKDINLSLGLDVHHYFKNFKELCKAAQIPYIKGPAKRSKKVEQKIIEYIKKNPTATQWEINRACKTHVQEFFKDGIREAYSLACVNYPEERRKLYGVSTKAIKYRSAVFESDVLNSFSVRGRIVRQYKTGNGIADGLINIEGQLFIVEVKDYHCKPICMREINQVLRYVEATPRCNDAIVVTRAGNKRVGENIYIDGNRISIISQEDIL